MRLVDKRAQVCLFHSQVFVLAVVHLTLGVLLEVFRQILLHRRCIPRDLDVTQVLSPPVDPVLGTLRLVLRFQTVILLAFESPPESEGC